MQSHMHPYEEAWGRFATEKRRPCDHRNRDWSDVATSQEMTRQPGARRGKEWMVPKMPAEKVQPSWFGLRFQTSGLQPCEKINFCCFKPQVCGSLLQQPQETISSIWNLESENRSRQRWSGSLGWGRTKLPNSYGATKRALSFLHPISTDEVKKEKKSVFFQLQQFGVSVTISQT